MLAAAGRRAPGGSPPRPHPRSARFRVPRAQACEARIGAPRPRSSLLAIKRKASREFDGEFKDYRIVVTDERGEIVAQKLIGDRRWW
jgi:hypothetical protein